MPAPYDLDFMNNVTNPVDVFTGVSNVIGSGVDQYLIGYLLLLSFFLIFLVLSLKFDFNEVIVADSFLTTLIAIGLYAAEMVPSHAIIYPFVLLCLSLVFLFITRK